MEIAAQVACKHTIPFLQPHALQYPRKVNNLSILVTAKAFEDVTATPSTGGKVGLSLKRETQISNAASERVVEVKAVASAIAEPEVSRAISLGEITKGDFPILDQVFRRSSSYFIVQMIFQSFSSFSLSFMKDNSLAHECEKIINVSTSDK